MPLRVAELSGGGHLSVLVRSPMVVAARRYIGCLAEIACSFTKKECSFLALVPGLAGTSLSISRTWSGVVRSCECLGESAGKRAPRYTEQDRRQ
ncbi:hypothetical protein MTO96_009548 [Rhipicephalus appendiculatus]